MNYIYDDGSTLTWDPNSGFVTATDAPADQINNPTAQILPGNASAGASDWTQVLQQGFSRSIDALTHTVALNNTQPVIANPAVIRNPTTGQITAVSQQGLFQLLLFVGILWYATHH